MPTNFCIDMVKYLEWRKIIVLYDSATGTYVIKDNSISAGLQIMTGDW